MFEKGMENERKMFQKGAKMGAEIENKSIKINANSMLEKGCKKHEKCSKMVPKRKPKSRKIYQKRGPKIDAKKRPRGHRRLGGQRVGRAAPILV